MKESKIVEREEIYWEKKDEFNWLTDKSVKKIVAKIPKHKGKCIELCIGSGMFTRFLNMDNVKEYIGLDISSSLLKRLKKVLPQIKTEKGDAQKIDKHKNKEFDYVYVFAGLHHLPRMKLSLNESYRILKTGGKFIAFEPNMAAIYRPIIYRLKNFLNLYTEDEIFLQPTVVKKMLQEVGFKKIRIDYVTPNYSLKHVKLLYLLFIPMKILSIIPGRRTQSFFIIYCEK